MHVESRLQGATCLPGAASGDPWHVGLGNTAIEAAIAAGLAAAAFRTAAAAPLGLYGILVLVWGTVAAGFLRQRAAEPAPSASESTRTPA